MLPPAVSVAAALETHQRRASPLPGAHVAADIRGASPEVQSAAVCVYVETTKEQASEVEDERQRETFEGER